MKHSLPPLDSFKVFESSARFLSFSKASGELCITKGAVSYQIKKLEQALDCQLFRRTTRQIYLTEAGQVLYQDVSRLLSELNDTLQRIKPDQVVDVSIAATTYFAARWLSPRVAKFLEQHPDTSIRFEHDINAAQFMLEEVDLAIVWGLCGAASDKSCLVELPMPLYPVGNPEIVRRLTENPALWQQLTLLSESREQDIWLEWFDRDVLHNPRQVIADANVRVQAAIDGQGLIMADAMMQSEEKAGLLVAPHNHQLDGYGYRFLRSIRRRPNSEALAMIDWLCEGYAG